MTDPIFAAIEQHRVAGREFGDTIKQQSRLEEELPKHLRKSYIDADEERVVETDDPRWIAATRAHSAALEKEGECAEALLDIRPTTLAGLIALLRYAEKADAGRDWPDQIASAAAEALEALTSGQPDEETEPDEPRPGSSFVRAYQEWIEARASIAKLNARGYVAEDEADDPDAACDRIMDRLSEAERQLVFQPAILPKQLSEKFETLETMIADRERDGRPNDSRHLAMFASVKADLHRLLKRHDLLELRAD